MTDDYSEAVKLAKLRGANANHSDFILGSAWNWKPKSNLLWRVQSLETMSLKDVSQSIIVQSPRTQQYEVFNQTLYIPDFGTRSALFDIYDQYGGAPTDYFWFLCQGNDNPPGLKLLLLMYDKVA